ncbi:bifunctional serine/threonine-protein kinase/ABC transporter substrate-binding protein [Streptomyces somaliensis DSM 40738]|uniref:ABC transporter substrate-binding protein n=1 Tax=Streptomyces somaliensis (strain ATCC 33201 / DSM 40738 / JCM 12659 / KCTC 9044 / NCTC 11332 / NRRL B-12077 / IP 733) TaxID=1134445 RepID=A0AA44DCP9_STRE0|nr:bifunctional serine/threonine-protein kinase/ABC transporter substrate-binding protein [Streptomyces somaliensis]MCQ0023233.1 bifunctional serine/threonine-protein kinase/ABC transporter substrate-binding protein [Streptomyces somaliensis DSM 40738]NKY13970.1 ABC transporter substrate-binding protein [Streptomyces somaliensis DSM 40738]
MDPLRGSDPARIAGHRLLGRLGEGGMGVVYLARTPGGGLVAVKVVQEEYADDAGFRERFRREVETARRVSSRWAVRLVDAGPDDTAPWLATEFLPGPSLAEAVALHGPLPPWGLRVLGARLAEALDDIHTAGLVHRDVKPGNVLLAPDGPRLIDFGIARTPEDTSLTATGIVVGTPGYLAPEQAGAGDVARVGPAGDVFSLGCVLVYAATGRPPFGTGPADALLYRTVHDAADTDGLPAETAGVVGRCLEKAPRLRPTAAEVHRALAGDGTDVEEPVRWLPEPVLRLIAERSTAALDLPGIDDTEVSGEPVGGDADGTRGERGQRGPEHPDPAGANTADEPGATTGRRRFLALSGGAALVAAGGGTALWAAVGRKEAVPAVKPRRPRYALALHADLSGADKAAGLAQERGLRLAVEQFNARRGRPYTLAVKVEDDGGDPLIAPRAAKALAADPAVLAVVGPTTDATAEACLATYDAVLAPVVAVSPGSAALTIQGYRSFLLARLPDAPLAILLSIYLRGFAKSRRVGIVEDRAADPHAWEVGDSLSRLLHDEGHPQVPKVVSASRDDFRPVVDALLAAGVDSVVFAGYPERAARIARVLHDRRFTGARISVHPLLNERFLTGAGEAAEGWLAIAPVADPALLPAGAAFTAAHKRRFGTAPARYSVEAYDTANMLIAGLARLGTARPTRAALLTAVRGTPYRGITKRFAFEKDGGFAPSNDNNGVFLWRVERGAFRCGGPAPTGVPS